MNDASQLADFVATQEPVYAQVVRELKAGHKQTHWMWFIFPQLAGLGSSWMSEKYGISSLADARGYLEHGVLGLRLRECTGLMLAIPHRDITSVFGYPDDLKFRSSMTLFAAAAPDEPLFQEALEKYFQGERDPLTIERLQEHS